MSASRDENLKTFRLAIIGSGFGGIGMAIRLKQSGIDDFVVLEKLSDVGGVWRDNTYPGCACDVESHLYSFSFAPNPQWTHQYADQGEIWAYLKQTAETFGVMPHVWFGAELLQAVWSETEKVWTIFCSGGPIKVQMIINASGAFSKALIPDIPHFDQFKGRSFHSSVWDHSIDLSGKRVAVLGTGASAVQFIPKVQKQAATLTVFQKTPAWVLPRGDKVLSDALKRNLTLFPRLLKMRLSQLVSRCQRPQLYALALFCWLFQERSFDFPVDRLYL